MSLLRWCLVLTPVALTVTWVRATSASEPDRVFAAGIAESFDVSGLPQTQLPSPLLEPITTSPPPTPEPAVDVDRCAIEPVVETTEREVKEAFMGPASSHAVALTFDDGPSRENTPRILDILARHEAHATFFVLGNRAAKMGDVLETIDAAGHEIGNHSFSHPNFKTLWKPQIRDEVCQTQRAVEDAIGKRPALFRPPFGRYAPSAVGVLGALGYDFVLWDTDAEDWRFDDPAQMADHVVRNAHSGSVILLHDRESITVHALPQILEGLERRGLQVVPVSELISLEPYQ